MTIKTLLQKAAPKIAVKPQPIAPPQAIPQVQPNLTAQLANAERFGHHFGTIRIQRRDHPADLPNRNPVRLIRSASQIQAKLTVTPAADQYEQEADAVARQVVQQINAPMPPNAAVQRVQEHDEDENKVHLLRIQRVARNTLGGLDVQPDVELQIQSARGSGTEIPDGSRAKLERAFGTDFSSVRIHTDSQADALNRSVQARAFTTGQDIFFRHGEYSPATPTGQQLLAHELTHVVQQNAMQRSSLAATVFSPSPVTTMRLIQREIDPDVTAGDNALLTSQGYEDRILHYMGRYSNLIRQLEGTDSHDTAERMASGYKAWAENLYNKTQAYLYEGQQAIDYTNTNRNPHTFGVLGVDTDEHPDLTIVINQLRDNYGSLVHDRTEHQAVEVKASTSPNYASFDGLVAKGVAQLRKRELAGGFHYLTLELHNDAPNNHWPITDHDFSNTYGNDISTVLSPTWNTRLNVRMAALKATHNIALPLRVRVAHRDTIYAETNV